MARRVDLPHLALPFRIHKRAAVIEQDTPEEIMQCVEVVLHTERGFRDEAPEFGIDDLSFKTDRAAPSAVRRALAENEERAVVTVEDVTPLEKQDWLEQIRIKLLEGSSG